MYRKELFRNSTDPIVYMIVIICTHVPPFFFCTRLYLCLPACKYIVSVDLLPKVIRKPSHTPHLAKLTLSCPAPKMA